MIAIFKREFSALFRGRAGWILISAFLFAAGILTSVLNILQGYSNFASVFPLLSYVFIPFPPILVLLTVSRDRHSGADRWLFSFPVSVASVVIGKYLAMLAVFAIPTAVMAIFPLILSLFGEISFGSAYSALLGFFLTGAALLALCTAIANFSRRRALPTVWNVLACGSLSVAPLFPGKWLSLVSFFVSPVSRLSGFLAGHLDLTAIFFDLTVTAFFLFLGVLAAERVRTGKEG